MKRAARDRGEIIHFAGAHRLSPALRADGSPAFASGPQTGVERCGWEALFGAMEARGLALAFDPEDPASAAFVPWAEARRWRRRPSLSAVLAHSLRFARALLHRRR